MYKHTYICVYIYYIYIILNYSWKIGDRNGISQKYNEIKQSFNNIFAIIGGIIMKFFSANKAWKEFQEVIMEYRKAFVPNLAVLQLGSINRQFIASLVS